MKVVSLKPGGPLLSLLLLTSTAILIFVPTLAEEEPRSQGFLRLSRKWKERKLWGFGGGCGFWCPPATPAPTPAPSPAPTNSPTSLTDPPTEEPDPVDLFHLKPVYFDEANGEMPIVTYKWLVVEDRTGPYEGSLGAPPTGCGPTDDGYPADCEWPSIRSVKAHAPIYSSGDWTEWGPTIPLDVPPTGKSYMVTVMAEGFRLCGGYFTAGSQSGPVTVNVICAKHPLPLGTIRMFIFNDTQPCNGQYDPGEHPLVDFGIGVNDIEGPITEDYYGNSLLDIVSDENGMIVVPNMWPGRYDLDVGPPPNSGWIKTNTLEGGHGWDYWLYEGWDGFDNEFVVGNEKFPFAVGGFIQVGSSLDPAESTVSLTGKISTVSPWPNGINFAEINGFDQNNAVIGASGREKGPLANEDGMYVISHLGGSDEVVHADVAAADGSFEVMIPPGDYQIAFFDIAQTYILRLKTFNVPETGSVDLGTLFLTGWYTEIEGFFFIDENENGIFDDGEEGIHNGPFPVLRLRDGTQVDRGLQFEVPFNDPARLGFYTFRHAYPFAQWLTLHAYHPLYTMTGYSYKTEQQEQMTTVEADASTFQDGIAFFGTPGCNTRLDVGFRLNKDLDANSDKGNILGSVVYDSTRVNLDAAQSVMENHEPGIPNIQVNLFHLADLNVEYTSDPSQCNAMCLFNSVDGFGHYCPHEGKGKSQGGQGLTCNRYYIGSEDSTKQKPITAWTYTDDGPGHSRGQIELDKDGNGPLSSVMTAEFETPTNCVITDKDNNPMVFGSDQNVLPDPSDPPVPCIETPLLRNQVGGFAEVDGTFKFSGLAPGYYALQVEIPQDQRGEKDAYKIRTENDINAFESDLWVGSGATCPTADESCPLPVDPGTPLPPNRQNYRMPCVGGLLTIKTVSELQADNMAFAKNGGSHHAPGEEVHYCDIKIVKVDAGQNARATFHLFTDVPIPSRWKGAVLDDRLPQGNKQSTLFTELLGVPDMPVGVYDYLGQKLTDVTTDPNGYFELLVPASRNNANAPSGSGLMPSMYCLVANDPGTFAHPSTTVRKSNYRSITACFEAMPGRIIPVDLAPVTTSAMIAQSNGDFIEAPCGLPEGKPELFVVAGAGPICPASSSACELTILGRNFAASQDGTEPTVTLSTPSEHNTGPYTPQSVIIPTVSLDSWDQDIVTISIVGGTPGMYQVELTNNDSGQSWMRGITVHVLGDGYNPKVYNSTEYDSIQEAIDEWESDEAAQSSGGIVMIYPKDATTANPEGAHFENLIMGFPPIKLQGIGVGESGNLNEATRGTQVHGGGILGAGTLCDPQVAPDQLFCDLQAKEDYKNKLVEKAAYIKNNRGDSSNDGILNSGLVEGPVLYVLGDYQTYNQNWATAGGMAVTGGIDGCLITGGVQLPAAGNLGEVQEEPQITSIQGGGITLHTYVRYFRITNNGIHRNGGSYAAGVRVGTALLDTHDGSGTSFNTELTIAHNSMLYNGAFNLGGGAIGLYGGSDNYVVADNYICGNDSQEYGGGISHFGTSPGGLIMGNWLLWNRAFDEGGCVIIASERGNLDMASTAYPYAGDVTISHNVMQACISGDDGGGLRFLNAGLSNYDVHDNIFTHNIAMHEGGGVSLHDAPYVKFHDNVVMNNIVSGTSAESNTGQLFPAGLGVNLITDRLKDKMLAESGFSQEISAPIPADFNHNTFWDNRASNGEVIGDGVTSPTELKGLGMNTPEPVYHYDIGSASSHTLEPSESIIQNFDTFFNKDCTNTFVTTIPFIPSKPFECVGSLLADSAGVVEEVTWGAGTMTIQVQGLVVTLAGTNTFHVVDSPAILQGGPIGDYSLIVTPAQPGPPRPLAPSLAGFSRDHDSEAKSHGYWWLLMAAPVVLFAVLIAGRLHKVRNGATFNANETDGIVQDEDQQALVGVAIKRRKGAAGRVGAFFMIAFGLANEARADPHGACTVDCLEAFTPIPEQIKYQTELFQPPVIDVRDTCDQEIELFMKEGYQDFGVKDELGNTLLTPIYGYAVNATAAPTYPGPTIIAKKDCPVKVTFHNKLGTGPHMFPLDRSIDCGNAHLHNDLCSSKSFYDGAVDIELPPSPDPADPNFYCRCTAPHGSERRTTTHLHGGHLQAPDDGHPDTWYTDTVTYLNGTSFVDGGEKYSASSHAIHGYNYYPNDQHACSLFYHDHAFAITRLNVYAGLVGFYLIEDILKDVAILDAFSANNSPLTVDEATELLLGSRDIGLAFADKVFGKEAGESEAHLIFPTGVKDGDGGGLPPFSILPEMFGYTMTVNGVVYPKFDVNNDGYYHFRLLNGCDSRFLRLYFEYEAVGTGALELITFTVIGADQGLLADPSEEDEILLGPAERYEIIISFAGLAAGTKVTLRNSEFTLLGPVEDGRDDQFMQFDVQEDPSRRLEEVRKLSDAVPPEFPAAAWTFQYDSDFQKLIDISRPSVLDSNILGDVINKREIWITERTSVHVDINTASGGRPLPMLGSRAQAFGEFYTDPITEEMVQNKPTVWEFLNLSNDAHVIHLHQIRFMILDRQDVGLSYNTFQSPHGMYRQYAKEPEMASGYEYGPKDILISYPGSVLRIIVVFDIPGEYVWHCHIISHEDHMMMRELVVDNYISLHDYMEKAQTDPNPTRRQRKRIRTRRARR